MRLALVADWLPTFGGAEHVVASLGKIWPDAPLFTTVAKADAVAAVGIADVRTSKLQTAYRIIGNHQILLPWMPRAIEAIDLTGFDVVLSSSHAVGKGVIVPSSAVHICYCHTPMRYAWEMEDQYLDDFHLRGFLRKSVKKQLKHLRRWDLSTAKRVDVFIANSSETQERIARIYGRDSTIVSPPVDDRFFASPLQKNSDGSFLALGRLVPYKRFDLLIELANQLQIPLTIAGTGQDEARLKSLAGPTVQFLGFVSDDQLPSLYASSKALLFPQYEDAGIVPLEAQACGTPVIAYAKGGVMDTVVNGVTGIFAANQTVDDFAKAIETFGRKAWDHEVIRNHARQFSEQKFQIKMKEIVEESVKNIIKKQDRITTNE